MAEFADLVAAARDVVRQHLGVPVTLDGRSVRVVWTVSEAAPTLGGLRQPVMEPAVLLHPADVCAGVAPGAVLVRDGVTYTVADVQPRADGWLHLILRAA